MIRSVVKEALAACGVELRRRSHGLPFIHHVSCGSESFRFWIANEHARRWWGTDVVADNAEFRMLARLCSPGDVAFDVGAHHGFMTVLLARWVGPRGQVHAFELNADNALVLFANVAANELGNTSATHCAVGSRAGTACGDGESVIWGRSQGREVPQIALDEYAAAKQLERVDLLKIDVEGYEGEVLRGCATLLGNRPKIALELHLDDLGTFGDSIGSVLNLLPHEGYQGRIMVRPDWETLTEWQGPQQLPRTGVVNLFLWPESNRES